MTKSKAPPKPCRVYLIVDSREQRVWDVPTTAARLLNQYGVRLITKKDEVFSLPTKAPPSNGAPSVDEELEGDDSDAAVDDVKLGSSVSPKRKREPQSDDDLFADSDSDDDVLAPISGDEDESDDETTGMDTATQSGPNIQLTIGDVWYVCDGHVVRIDEIKVKRDYINSHRSGHLDEQLTRARTSEVPELGLLIVQNIANLPPAEQLGMLTKDIRQENHKFRRVHFEHIPSEDLMACYFARVAQTLEERLDITKAEVYTPTPAALLGTTKKASLDSGFMIYQRMLSLVRGIKLKRAMQIAALAPGLSDLRECLENDDPHLLALTNKPMRKLLRDLLQMPLQIFPAKKKRAPQPPKKRRTVVSNSDEEDSS